MLLSYIELGRPEDSQILAKLCECRIKSQLLYEIMFAPITERQSKYETYAANLHRQFIVLLTIICCVFSMKNADAYANKSN